MRLHGIHIFDNIVEIVEILFTPCSIWLYGKMHVVNETWDIETNNSYKMFCMFTSLQIPKDKWKIDTLQMHYKLYKYSISWFQWWTFHANLSYNNELMKEYWQRKYGNVNIILLQYLFRTFVAKFIYVLSNKLCCLH